ncbi:MAG: prepilin peptidase [Legionellales bacterium]|nr:prepilin peptidase [Legionellales bacterium]|tara:strand:- start:47313 stop:48179 length:867 start_codon:yes stop_codon:yes gene_type:complete
MDIIAVLHVFPIIAYVFIFLLGLVIGSFLNVVIHRLPLMMYRDWHEQCQDFAKEHPNPPTEKLNLMLPRSRCPYCKHTISAKENIPIISYFLQRGKCKHCQGKISPRYPVIEGLSAILGILILLHFGISWQTVGGLILTWSLVALSFIDLDEKLLPDSLTLFLLWLGLFLNLFSLYTDINSAVIGAIAGYVSLWGFTAIFNFITKKQGMGHGDFKLFAVFGAWLGWQLLPFILLAASVVGAIVGIILIACKKHQRADPIPFGPYLALAGWICLVFGEHITHHYLQFFH